MQVLWIVPGLDLCPGPQSPLPAPLPTRPAPSAARPPCTAAGRKSGLPPPQEAHHALGICLLGWCPEPALLLPSERERAVGLSQPFPLGCAGGDERASSLGQRRKRVTHRVSKLCSPSKPLAPRLWIRLLCRCLWTKQRRQWRCKLTSSC